MNSSFPTLPLTVFITNNWEQEKRLVSAEINLLSYDELLTVDEQEFSKFEWKTFVRNVGEIWKLVIGSRIVGLVRLDLDSFDDEMEIRYLEVSPEFQSGMRRYSGVGGTLIAFACREAIRVSSGKVRVLSLREVHGLYLKKCGFSDDGCFFRSTSNNSARIIERYLIISSPSRKA